MSRNTRVSSKWIVAAALVLAALPAAAQTSRVEVSALAGWTMSDGVSGDTVLGGDGNLYDEVGPKDSGSWGLMFGVNATDHVELGFLFTQQNSTAEIKGTATREIGDLTINTYHPYVAYNFMPSESPVRPYVLLGLGATNFGGVSFTTITGAAIETESDTQYSGTFGAGVKIFARNVGLRLGAQWTPTYIKSDADGWWCDPYWGCYVVGDAQYANQFTLNAGVTFRF
jgi:outer membrane protein W